MVNAGMLSFSPALLTITQLEGSKAGTYSLNSCSPIENTRITLNRPHGREEAHGIRWSMRFFIPEHTVVNHKSRNNLPFHLQPQCCTVGGQQRCSLYPEQLHPTSRYMACWQKFLQVFFFFILLKQNERKEKIDPGSHQMLYPRRRKILQHLVKKYIYPCLPPGKFLKPYVLDVKTYSPHVLQVWGK